MKTLSSSVQKLALQIMNAAWVDNLEKSFEKSPTTFKKLTQDNLNRMNKDRPFSEEDKAELKSDIEKATGGQFSLDRGTIEVIDGPNKGKSLVLKPKMPLDDGKKRFVYEPYKTKDTPPVRKYQPKWPVPVMKSAGEITYKDRGIVEIDGHEFDYSATLYFGDTRKPDEFEITPVIKEDEDLLEKIRDKVEDMASDQAHKNYQKEKSRIPPRV